MSDSLPQKPQSPAASHMLWFFLLPAAIFLGWATFQLASGLSAKKTEPTLVEKAKAISKGRSDGDRWKSAYAFAEELLKKSKDGTYKTIPESQRKEIVSALSLLMTQFKDDVRLKKYLILTLGRLNDIESLPLLKENLADTDADLRFYSAWGYLETLAANPEKITDSDLALIRGWLKSDDTAFQKIATTFLVKNDKAGPAVILPLLSDKDKEVRWNAAVALAAVGRKEGVPTLQEIFVLKNLRDFGFRSAKDMEQLLKSAKVATLKLNDADVIKSMRQLNSEANLATPEGRAIRAALD